MGDDLQPRNQLRTSDEDPGRTAIECAGRSLTYAEVDTRTRRLANLLLDRGIDDGQRYALLSGNRVEWAELALACYRTGSRFVPLNWHLGAGEVHALLETARARVLFVDPAHESVAREAAAGTEVREIIVLGEEYEALLAEQDDTPPSNRRAGSVLLFTGGTTGRSKGVNRSDQGWPTERTPDALATWPRGPGRDGTFLLTTPLYHAMGYAMLVRALGAGHRLIVHERFEPEEALATIERERVTAGFMVPTQFIRLLKLPEELRRRHDVSSLQWMIHTAAPCPPWVKRAMIDWFGPVINELYGASEGIGPVVCTSEEWLAHPGTVGRPTPGLDIFIVDDDGNDLPPGEVGMIYGRRADGAPEYDGDPEKTAASRLPDGRFTVGDYGYLDDDGFLYLADRRVDLIISGGVNIYPAEIEGVLVEHPAVGDVAVFGIPHPEWGQEIKAVVEPADGSDIDVAELQEFVRERLSSLKVPRTVDVVDALPREAHGKLKKHKLRAPYWDGVDVS